MANSNWKIMTNQGFWEFPCFKMFQLTKHPAERSEDVGATVWQPPAWPIPMYFLVGCKWHDSRRTHQHIANTCFHWPQPVAADTTFCPLYFCHFPTFDTIVAWLLLTNHDKIKQSREIADMANGRTCKQTQHLTNPWQIHRYWDLMSVSRSYYLATSDFPHETAA